MIRVLLVDDQSMLRRGFRMFLNAEDDLEVVGEAGDGATAIGMAGALRPDVVLMDIRMPGIDGIAATERIVSARPQSRVLILTTFDLDEYVFAGLKAGASGFLLKDAEPDELLRGVHAAARGDWPIDPRVARLVLDNGRDRRHGPKLSERERQVLILVGDGLANKLIARRLGITERTVKAHLTRIYEQLGVTDRTQAALWAQRHGFVAESSSKSPIVQPR